MNIREIAAIAPVVPMLTVSELAQAVPLAQALVAGGLRVMEINVRSAMAINSIEAIRKAVPAAIIGAGSLTRPADFAAAGRAGAQFGSSPGLTAELAAAARGARFPLCPGIMTPTEAISARHSGFDVLKLFPAQHAGGVQLLNAFSATLTDVAFWPAGGMTLASAVEYLPLENVICTEGSWVVPLDLLRKGDWKAIEGLAREAALLKRGK